MKDRIRNKVYVVYEYLNADKPNRKEKLRWKTTQKSLTRAKNYVELKKEYSKIKFQQKARENNGETPATYAEPVYRIYAYVLNGEVDIEKLENKGDKNEK